MMTALSGRKTAHLLAMPFRMVVRFYQILLSPFLHALFPGLGCRFEPTCSGYALECFSRHTIWVALGLSLKRVARCHPFHPGGYDPVPLRDEK